MSHRQQHQIVERHTKYKFVRIHPFLSYSVTTAKIKEFSPQEYSNCNCCMIVNKIKIGRDIQQYARYFELHICISCAVKIIINSKNCALFEKYFHDQYYNKQNGATHYNQNLLFHALLFSNTFSQFHLIQLLYMNNPTYFKRYIKTIFYGIKCVENQYLNPIVKLQFVNDLRGGFAGVLQHLFFIGACHTSKHFNWFARIRIDNNHLFKSHLKALKLHDNSRFHAINGPFAYIAELYYQFLKYKPRSKYKLPRHT